MFVSFLLFEVEQNTIKGASIYTLQSDEEAQIVKNGKFHHSELEE